MHVLVPLDGSPPAEAALETAFEMFPDARIEVLHVIGITSLPKGDSESAADRAAETADEVLERAEEIAADRGRDVETSVEGGNVAKTIVSYAEANDVDHIVMGSVGRSGIRRLMLGSVAESAIRQAPCAVTVTGSE